VRLSGIYKKLLIEAPPADVRLRKQFCYSRNYNINVVISYIIIKSALSIDLKQIFCYNKNKIIEKMFLLEEMQIKIAEQNVQVLKDGFFDIKQ